MQWYRLRNIARVDHAIFNFILLNITAGRGVQQVVFIFAFTGHDITAWSSSSRRPISPSYIIYSSNTFSIKFIVGWRSIPKSIKVHWIPSISYSSCSNTNMKWLKYCCNFSLVKLTQSWLNPFTWTVAEYGKNYRNSSINKIEIVDWLWQDYVFRPFVVQINGGCLSLNKRNTQ